MRRLIGAARNAAAGVVVLACALGSPALHALEPGAEPWRQNGARFIVEDSGYPWSALGRVNRETGGHCTGTLIGPRHVATAAHCLKDARSGVFLRPAQLHFVAGYKRGNFLAHSLVSEYAIGGKPPAAGQGEPDPATDWAVLTLERDIGSAVGYLAVLELSASIAAKMGANKWPAVQAGYGERRPHILSRHDGCRIFGTVASGRLIAHACEASKGDSGSPILVRRGKTYYLLAVHVAQFDVGSTRMGLAVPASALAKAAGGKDK